MGNTTTEQELLHGDLVYQIMGCCFEVLKELGHGLHEKPYENALMIAFGDAGIAVAQQEPFAIKFRDQVVGQFIPDLVVDGAVIIETKVIDRITDHERSLMLNYLRITGLRVGLVVNFKHAKLQWERVVL